MFVMDFYQEPFFIIPFSTLILIVLLNLYLIKRNGLYVPVKCWFCNSRNKVLYGDRNSFVCSTCTQYNGFDRDGGYNKVIEAQHNTSNVFNDNRIKTEGRSNGLCSYCNNNLQLKVQQLANFTPMKENNYDIEVEHFRQQLEKSYKLCRKCNKVLKQTIQYQNRWIFGNRLKAVHNKCMFKINQTADYIKTNNFSRFVRYCLIATSVLSLCHILKISIEYPNLDGFKLVIADFVNKYCRFVVDIYLTTSKVAEKIVKDIEEYKKLQNLEFKNNSLVAETLLGFFLQIVLMAVERAADLRRINEALGWVLMMLTAVFFSSGNSHMEILQVLVGSGLIYSYITSKLMVKTKTNPPKSKPRKFIESSDEEEEEEPTPILPIPSPRMSSHCQYYRPSSPLHNYNTFQDKMDTSNDFKTAKSTSFSQETLSTESVHSELHQGLNNLHLNNLRPCVSPVNSISSQKRPVLTPPKLNVTHNAWVAGGFWKNDVFSNKYLQPSRSSSQSSGFISNNHSLPPSREQSPFNCERSILSDEVPFASKTGPIYYGESVSNLGQNVMYFQGYSPPFNLSNGVFNNRFIDNIPPTRPSPLIFTNRNCQ